MNGPIWSPFLRHPLAVTSSNSSRSSVSRPWSSPLLMGTQLILELFLCFVRLLEVSKNSCQVAKSMVQIIFEMIGSRWLGSQKLWNLSLVKRKSRLNNRMVSRRLCYLDIQFHFKLETNRFVAFVKTPFEFSSKEPKEWQSFPQLFERTNYRARASFLNFFQSIFMTSHQ